MNNGGYDEDFTDSTNEEVLESIEKRKSSTYGEVTQALDSLFGKLEIFEFYKTKGYLCKSIITAIANSHEDVFTMESLAELLENDIGIKVDEEIRTAFIEACFLLTGFYQNKKKYRVLALKLYDTTTSQYIEDEKFRDVISSDEGKQKCRLEFHRVQLPLIDCIGVDRKKHLCEIDSDKCICGVDVFTKRIDENNNQYFSCYECTY